MRCNGVFNITILPQDYVHGLIEEVGPVIALRVRDHGRSCKSPRQNRQTRQHRGEHCVNGCCLTLTSCRSDCELDLLEEQSLVQPQQFAAERSVNLERALRADGLLGGHSFKATLIASPHYGLRPRKAQTSDWKSNCRKTPGIMWLPRFDPCKWNQSYDCGSSSEKLRVWIIPTPSIIPT